MLNQLNLEVGPSACIDRVDAPVAQSTGKPEAELVNSVRIGTVLTARDVVFELCIQRRSVFGWPLD